MDGSKVKINNCTSLHITIIYDNNSFSPFLQSGWGFSCLVKSGINKILFDSGDNGEALMNNFEKLRIQPESINFIFLSHYHNDHTGGLKAFLKVNNNVTVFVPKSFPTNIKEEIKETNAKIICISSFNEILPNIYSIGELGKEIPEQSMAIRTDKGIIIITGCAHPGIVNIIKRAKEFFLDENIYLVIGGFHLYNSSTQEIKKIMDEFNLLKVMNVAPCHCSGNNARTLFKEAFGEHYIEIGTGKIIEI